MIEKIAAQIDEFSSSITESLSSFVQQAGAIVIFMTDAIRASFRKPNRYLEVIRHMEFVGNQSVFIIMLTGTFTGLALAYQIYLGFKMVNATNLVGPIVGLGITRELGPVLTGLIVAARAGGAMAARLGTMRVNEQIDALDVMGVNTKQYLIAPRVIASVICMPLLCAIFDFVAMVGAWFLAVKVVDLDEAIFWDKVRATIEIRHINEGLFKAAVFGLVFSTICCYRGFNTSGGAKGVGEATNRGVVLSMVMIIVLDYFLTSFLRIVEAMMGFQV
jgi:phospholipid/cholesterol/gamma-HCH transport system permease protein